jgi:hypothetical protein
MLFYLDEFGDDENLSLITSWKDTNRIRLFYNKSDKDFLLVSEAYSCGRMSSQNMTLSLSTAKSMFPHLVEKFPQD